MSITINGQTYPTFELKTRAMPDALLIMGCGYQTCSSCQIEVHDNSSRGPIKSRAMCIGDVVLCHTCAMRTQATINRLRGAA